EEDGALGQFAHDLAAQHACPRLCSSYYTSVPAARSAATNARQKALSSWLWLTNIRNCCACVMLPSSLVPRVLSSPVCVTLILRCRQMAHNRDARAAVTSSWAGGVVSTRATLGYS